MPKFVVTLVMTADNDEDLKAYFKIKASQYTRINDTEITFGTISCVELEDLLPSKQEYTSKIFHVVHCSLCGHNIVRKIKELHPPICGVCGFKNRHPSYSVNL